MRIILTGGITGGHIYPALAIGDKFREMQPDTEIIFIGSGGGMENDIVPRHGYKLLSVTTREFDRSNIFKVAGTFYGTEKGKREAYNIMKRFRPDVVISTGSFVSVPVVMAAKKYGAKVFIHEQNAFPGLANRSMANHAERIFLGFRTAGDYFSGKAKTMYSGNPVRKEFLNADRRSARSKLGVAEGEKLIFVFGGSLGASALNEVGVSLVDNYGGREGVSIFFGTGKRYYEKVSSELRALGLDRYSNVRVQPYVQDMPDALAACDLVIARSGALSVAEITVAGKPAIFIPSPNVTADHQYYNAKEVADQGGAVIVHEDEDTAAKVVSVLEEMIVDSELLRCMSEASLRAAPLNATDIIYDEIMKCIGE